MDASVDTDTPEGRITLLKMMADQCAALAPEVRDMIDAAYEEAQQHHPDEAREVLTQVKQKIEG